MLTIYKYILEGRNDQTIEIEGLVQILSVMGQKDDIVLYALVDHSNFKMSDVDVSVFGTGHNIPDKMINPFGDRKFLGTVLLYEGSLIFHVFYRVKE